MEEGVLCRLPRRGEIGDIIRELCGKTPRVEELCNVTDPANVSEESAIEDLRDTEEGPPEITDLQLDVHTASNLLDISEDQKIASRSETHRNRPETPERFQWPQVLSSQSFSSGRHSWEVVSGESRSWIVGMCYPSIDRTQWQSVIGNNPKSWCLVRSGNRYSVIHDKEERILPGKISSNRVRIDLDYSVIHDKEERRLPGKISSNRVRIDLDYEAGQISFYELGDPTRRLHTFTASFTEPLHAALCVWEGCVATSRGANMEEVQQTSDVTGNGDLILDVDTAYNKLLISHDKKTASWSYHLLNRQNTLKRFHRPQVLSCQRFFSGQHSWEVDVGASDSWRVGMCYPSIDRSEWQSVIGNNRKSWCLVRLENGYSAIHDSHETQLPVKISGNRFRIFLDYEAGQLSFYALGEPIRHLHTFTATFTEPLHAAIWVSLGCVRISGKAILEASERTPELLEEADILLDVNSASNFVAVSDDGKRACWTYDNQNRPETPKRFHDYPQVLSSQSFDSGRHYWEVDVGPAYSWRLGMCYPSLDRVGKPGSAVGKNDKSWCLDMDGTQYSARHAGNITQLPYYISSNRIRIYLDYEAGQLSFYELRDPIRHLHTFTATFTEPLHAIVCVWEGYMRISGGGSAHVELPIN
ncbi:uncharacterized protein LOC120928780 [Rana temporaria]|uniref:uncharacterized protein LOC120928780 n=1 Tax=Rana temporaria TaxID=8407 RepID=UPI001AAD235B|nr:uncharacterized protein LOC120928780 [Rana temporaria]